MHPSSRLRLEESAEPELASALDLDAHLDRVDSGRALTWGERIVREFLARKASVERQFMFAIVIRLEAVLEKARNAT